MPPRKKRREALQRTRPYQPAPDAPVFQLPENVDPVNLRYLSYDIVYDPMENSEAEMPGEIAPRAEQLYAMVQDDPEKAVAELQPLVERYPDSPRLANYLISAHIVAGHDDIARQLTDESFRRFPNYLFAVIGKLMQLLKDRQTAAAAAILGKRGDLKIMYPERERFHITEFLSFNMVAGWLQAQQGNFKAAETYYQGMAKLEPDAPQTEQLKGLIDSERMQAALQKLAGMAKGQSPQP